MARRSRQQWQELIDAQRVSGQKASEFCKQHDISPTYFSSKKRQLGATESSRFLKVIAEPELQVSEHKETGVAKGLGRQRLRIVDLDLGASVDANTLKTLIDQVLR